MPRLSQRDVRRLDELDRELRCWRTGARPVLAELVPRLRELLDTDSFAAYSIRVEEDHLRREVFAHTGMRCDRAEVDRRFDDFLARRRRRPGAYDAARPEPAQQNRILVFPPTLEWIDELEAGGERWASRLGAPRHELEAHLREDYEPWLRPIGASRRQMRVLICQGGSLLAYVGAAELGIGQSTVELHVTKLLEKAEAQSRAQLIARFWSLR